MATPLDLTSHYKLEQVLSWTGVARTFRGLDPDTAEPVAVKLLTLGASNRAADAQRFESGIEILRSLQHPSLPEIVAGGVAASGDAYLVTRWIEGPSLSEVESPSVEVVLTTMLRTVEGLESLALHGLVHLNLVPENVLLGEEGAKLIGWGPSLVTVDRQASPKSSSDGPIHTFTAPELLQPRRAGEALWRADLYSVALMSARLLGAQIAAAGTPSPTVRFSRELSDQLGRAEELRAVLQRCLIQDPEQRPGAYSELTRALQHAMPRTARAVSDTQPVAVPKNDSTEPMPTAPSEDATVQMEPGAAADAAAAYAAQQAAASGEDSLPGDDAPPGNFEATVAMPTAAPEGGPPPVAPPPDAPPPPVSPSATVQISAAALEEQAAAPEADDAEQALAEAAESTGTVDTVPEPELEEAPEDTVPAPPVLSETVALPAQASTEEGVAPPRVDSGTIPMAAPEIPNASSDATVRTPLPETPPVAPPPPGEPPTVEQAPPEIPNADDAPAERLPPAPPPSPPSAAEDAPAPSSPEPPVAAPKSSSPKPPAVEAPAAAAPAAEPRTGGRIKLPWILAAAAVGGLLLLLGLVLVVRALLGGGEEEPEPTPVVQTPVAVEPNPELIVSDELRPDAALPAELLAAMDAAAEGNLLAARSALAPILELEADGDLAPELCEAVRSFEQTLVLLRVDQVQRGLAAALQRASPDRVQRVLRAMNRGEEVAVRSAGGAAAIDRGRALVQANRDFEGALEDGDAVAALQVALDYRGQDRASADALGWVDRVLGILDSRVDVLISAGRLEEAETVLDRIDAAQPGRSGSSGRRDRIAQERASDRRFDTLLAAARETGERRRPHEGIEMIDGAQLPGDRRAPFAALRAELTEQFQQLDRQAPSVDVVGEPEFRRGDAAEVLLRVQDDYEVVGVRAFVRQARATSFIEVQAERTGEGEFRLSIDPSVHGDRNLRFYVEARDRSGHTGTAGSEAAPLEIKRKRWYN